MSAWKKELEERMAEIFDRKNAIDEAAQKQEKLTARLERKVGQLVIEKEFLEKSAISWGSISAKGSQFTGQDWIGELKKNDILVSMDGKGRWMDNLFIERLWRSLKYEKNHANNRPYHYPKNSRRARNHWRCCHRRHVRTRCRY